MKHKSHPLYRTWKSMRARCNNANSPCYLRYGGRGISICLEWNNFKQFASDMGARPEGKTLDRIDNDGPYAPWNCRWATNAEQVRNSRAIRLITHQGETLCVTEWAARFGVTQSAMSHRIRRHGTQRAINMGRPS